MSSDVRVRLWNGGGNCLSEKSLHRLTYLWNVPLYWLSEPCEKTYCAWGASCVVSENGKAICQCPVDCSPNPQPVCGSDNVTYTNHCHLRQESCQRRKNTRVRHQGACGESLSLFIPNPVTQATYLSTLREIRISQDLKKQKIKWLSFFFIGIRFISFATPYFYVKCNVMTSILRKKAISILDYVIELGIRLWDSFW